MSERETFVARWSRRKRTSTQDSESSQPAVPADAGAEAQGGEGAPSAGKVGDSDKDRATVPQLPPLESIVAQSDVRAFLAPGVPAELTRAALRRAWSADPKIRDFIGLSENSWDFNAPGAIPGFGPLELTDELRREIARMIGRSLEEKMPDVLAHSSPDRAMPEATPPKPTTLLAPGPAAAPPLPAGQEAPVQVRQDDSSVPRSGSFEPVGPEHQECIPKRRHGGALPQ